MTQEENLSDIEFECDKIVISKSSIHRLQSELKEALTNEPHLKATFWDGMSKLYWITPIVDALFKKHLGEKIVK